MQRILSITLAVLVLFFGVNVATAQSSDEGQQAITKTSVVNKSPDFNLYGRLQTIGFMQSLKDSYASNTRLYLFLKQARLGMNGSYEGVKFDLQLAFGGEEEAKAPSPGVTLSLLDLSADIPLSKSLFVKVGQFKGPFSREDLTSSGYLQFADRSIQYMATKLGRDVGLAVHGYSGQLAGVVGLFTGGGRDVPIRSIPQDLGIPMVVVRTGINNGYDKDMFTLKQTEFEPAKTSYAFFVSGLYTKDSKVGHSTALNVKLADKSLLLNSNWNPFIAKRPFSKGDFWQAGMDGAFRTPLDETISISGEAEVNYGSYSNDYGKVQATGGRAQLGVYNKPFEIALRYAFIKPDENFAATDAKGVTTKILDGNIIHELALGISYYIKSERVKLTADLPVLFGAPVVNDFSTGAYVLTEQPDQVTYITAPTNGKIERQTVVNARMQLQFIF